MSWPKWGELTLVWDGLVWVDQAPIVLPVTVDSELSDTQLRYFMAFHSITFEGDVEFFIFLIVYDVLLCEISPIRHAYTTREH